MTTVTPTPSKSDAPSPGLRHLFDRRRIALLALAEGASEEDREEIQIALAAIDGLVKGDLDAIPKVVAGEIATWISASRPMGAELLRKAAAEVRRKRAVVHQAEVEASQAAERKAAADLAIEEHAAAEQALLRELNLVADHEPPVHLVRGGRM